MKNWLVYAYRYGYPEEGGFPYKGYNSVAMECETEEIARKIGGQIIENSDYYASYHVINLRPLDCYDHKEYFINGS